MASDYLCGSLKRSFNVLFCAQKKITEIIWSESCLKCLNEIIPCMQ